MDLNILKQLTFIHLCIAISFLSSGLILATIQAILFFTLGKVNKYAYRKLNYYLNYSFYSQMVFMSEWWSGTETIIYIDKDDFDKYYGKEHAYLIMNHSYEIDWLIGWQFCEYIKVLGNCKAYVKKSIQYIPPLGWMWKSAEFIFLDRSFEKDKATIEQQISVLGDYPDPIWLLLFPEGTRFSSKKHEASQKFAREKGLPMLKHHLTPRTKGFTTSLPAMRGKINALYDIQIAFKKDAEVPPTMTSLLFGKTVVPHLYINRIPIEDIPTDEEECAKWVHKLFEMKDRMMDSFHQTGDYFKLSGVKSVPAFKNPRRPFSLINTVCWNIVILVPTLRWLIGLLFSGELLYFTIACAVFGGFYFALKSLIGMSEISKGSSYGVEKKKN